MAASFNTVLFLSVCQLLSTSADQQLNEITAHFGKNVTLTCEAPKNVTVAAVEWSRTDLQNYVYFQRGRRPLTEDQDPSFVDRVQLKGQMKDGDLSLILTNVNSNDNGTYTCRYVGIEGRRWKRADESKLATTIILNVEGPARHVEGVESEPAFNADQTPGDSEGGKVMRGYNGIILPVAVLIVLSVLAAGFVISKKSKGGFSDLPVDEAEVQQQLQEKANSQSKAISVNISDIQV